MGLWASKATGYTTTFLASLPRECYLAAAHATAICTGQDPHYYAVPGFGPIVLGYGWMVVGIIAGVLIMQSMVLQRPPPVGPPHQAWPLRLYRHKH